MSDPKDSDDAPGDGRGLILGTGPRGGIMMLRQDSPDSPPEVGEVLPAREGEPMRGELLDLKATSPGSRVLAVKSLWKPEEPEPKRDCDCDQQEGQHAGPARVNTQAYRDHWDAIFGGRKSTSPSQPPTTQRSAGSHLN